VKQHFWNQQYPATKYCIEGEGTMEQRKYLHHIVAGLNNGNHSVCEDCGRADLVAHAIFDHDTDTMKTVCSACFKSKYLDFLYSVAEAKSYKNP
jgi:hypothetical protein